MRGNPVRFPVHATDRWIACNPLRKKREVTRLLVLQYLHSQIQYDDSISKFDRLVLLDIPLPDFSPQFDSSDASVRFSMSTVYQYATFI